MELNGALGKANTHSAWIAANSLLQGPNGPTSHVLLGGLAAPSAAPLKSKSSSQHPTAPQYPTTTSASQKAPEGQKMF